MEVESLESIRVEFNELMGKPYDSILPIISKILDRLQEIEEKFNEHGHRDHWSGRPTAATGQNVQGVHGYWSVDFPFVRLGQVSDPVVP